jgi:hypothetical protein
MIHAKYPHFAFSGDGKTFDTVTVGGDESGLTAEGLFVRGADGRTYDVARLEEDVVRQWVEEEPNEAVRKTMIDKGKWHGELDFVVYRFPSRSLLFFHEGKLISASFANASYGPFQGLEVGATSDGEFLKMPATRQEMIRVFGSPKKWTESRLSSP